MQCLAHGKYSVTVAINKHIQQESKHWAKQHRPWFPPLPASFYAPPTHLLPEEKVRWFNTKHSTVVPRADSIWNRAREVQKTGEAKAGMKVCCPAAEAKGCVHFILKKTTERDVGFIPKWVSHNDAASWGFIQEGPTHIYLLFQIVQEFPELQMLHDFR